jgi:predicted ATPase
MLGRAQELARVAELLQECRFVTIVGPGGMGKTTLACALARDCAELYPDGVRFIDLAVLAEGRELVGALGAALGLARLTRDGLAQLATSLRAKRMLIIFDCCEHHTAVAAQASEALLRAAPGIDVLCTSREPLLAQSERIVRLGPMGLPNAAGAPDVEAALRFPAVELFLARANADKPAGFFCDSRTVALVCNICRAVEGVPLALELAAALVRPMGLESLAQQTSKCLLEPAAGQPHTSGRHSTLSSMLDWSYDVLSADEQRVLRCLAVFRGGFTLEAAGAVAAGTPMDADRVLDTVIELASKSLVSTNAGGAVRPRLLDLTREYAYDKLVRSGELHAVQERHARWLGALMERLERDWMELPHSAWVDLYGHWVDDILAAVDWALGPGGDPLLGLQLAGSGFSLGDQIGVARDFRDCVQRAVKAFGNPANSPVSTMAILWRLGAADADGRDLSGHDYRRLMADAERNLALARKTGSPVLQAFPLMAMWGWPYVRADYPASLSGAEQVASAARDSGDPYLELFGQRTMAQSLHYLGRHAQARHCAGLALAKSELRIPLAYAPTAVQLATSMRIVLARVLWMEGMADRALAMCEEALASAEKDRPVALCQTFCLAAAPVAIWRGDMPLAARHLARLRDCAEGHGLGFWLDWSRRFEHALAVIAGAADAQSLPSFGDTHEFSAKCRDHLATFSPRLLAADAALRCETGLVAWCAPELLRARALGRLATDGADADGAAALLLQQSLDLAQRQGALAWMLRSATSLAALYQRGGAEARARATLEPVLARCHEGGATADVRAAHAQMASLGYATS